MVVDASAATVAAATSSRGGEDVSDLERPTHVRFTFARPDDYAIIELLWEKAPRTCAALVV